MTTLELLIKLWPIGLFLLGICVALGSYIARMKSIEKKIDLKLDTKDCNTRHAQIQKDLLRGDEKFDTMNTTLGQVKEGVIRLDERFSIFDKLNIVFEKKE